jgi:hypothetical protein
MHTAASQNDILAHFSTAGNQFMKFYRDFTYLKGTPILRRALFGI